MGSSFQREECSFGDKHYLRDGSFFTICLRVAGALVVTLYLLELASAWWISQPLAKRKNPEQLPCRKHSIFMSLPRSGFVQRSIGPPMAVIVG